MIILIVIHIFLLSNLQFTAWPEMLSFSYMIDNGFVIYKDFHHVYQPLLTFTLLSFFKIFGFNIISLKTFTYILIALTDLFVFLNVKKLTDKNVVKTIYQYLHYPYMFYSNPYLMETCFGMILQ